MGPHFPQFSLWVPFLFDSPVSWLFEPQPFLMSVPRCANCVLLSSLQVSIVDSGVRGTIAVGLVPQYYSLDHQPGWLPDSVAYHADDGK